MSLNNVFSWERLNQKAKDIGFTDIGVTHIKPLEKDRQKLQKWITAKLHGSMEYMQKTQNIRSNIESFFPNAKSVLVCTMSYYRKTENKDKTGQIARYAQGRDYHKVMKKKLQELSNFLQNECFPHSQRDDFRISLDTHPVLERAWAREAKMGFIGKNSCLITEKAGSWVMIGCIITTQDMLEKSQHSEQNIQKFSEFTCGNCKRCIDKCPTGAIIEPGVIDARKCISYLTIENKAGIPEDLRDKMGDRIFGCDICQEVCPYNSKKSTEEWSPLTETTIAGSNVLIQEILEIQDDEAFLKRFAGSPLMRAKRVGMLRNACVVAGNSKNQAFIPLLSQVLEREKNEMVKEHAIWALNKILKKEKDI